MNNLRKSFLRVMLLALLCVLGQLARADDTLVVNPSKVTAGSAPPPVKISWAKALASGESGLSTTKTVTINGRDAALIGNPAADALTVDVPVLQITGPAEVKVLDKDNKVLGTAHLLYVAQSDTAAESAVAWHPWVLAGFALVFVLFPFSLMFTDILKAYTFSGETRTRLMEALKGHSLTLEELKTLIAEFDTSPPGIPGLARATLALTLLLLLGLIIFYFLAVTGHDIPTGIDKFLTSLTTAFAAVIAFYFGTKAAQSNPQSGTTSPQTTPGAPGNQPPSNKTITLSTSTGHANDTIVLHGSGFGTAAGTVTFGSTPATTTLWTDSQVTTTVPTGLTAGAKMTVALTTANGTVFKSAQDAFTAE